MGIVCASDPALVVGATHRGHTHRRAGRVCSPSSAEPSASPKPNPPHCRPACPTAVSSLGLVTAGGAWLLEPTAAAQGAMPDDVPEVWRNLASAVLQHVVLEPLLGIDADVLAAGQAVTYTHHFNELLEAVQSGQASAAFILPAPTLQDVIDTADAGSFMPQKSTYFVPKLPTGLVLHPLGLAATSTPSHVLPPWGSWREATEGPACPLQRTGFSTSSPELSPQSRQSHSSLRPPRATAPEKSSVPSAPFPMDHPG